MVAQRILIVDDEPNQRLLLTAALTTIRPSCQILHAATGSEALAVARTHPIDLLITDYRMPAMSGLDLIARLRAGYTTLPIILVSAYSLTEYVDQIARLRIAHLLLKPFPLETLRGLASNLLARC